MDTKTCDEYRQAGRVLEARAAYITLLAKSADLVARALSLGIGKLSRLDAELAVAGVWISTTPPDGLRWRLHPPHVACLAAFRRLQACASAQGLDFGALERLDRIGTLHASALYERWCLVKILTVLINDYRFQPPPAGRAGSSMPSPGPMALLPFIYRAPIFGWPRGWRFSHFCPMGEDPTSGCVLAMSRTRLRRT